MYLRLKIVLRSCERVLRSAVICFINYAIPEFKVSGVGFYMTFHYHLKTWYPPGSCLNGYCMAGWLQKKRIGKNLKD